MKKKKPLKSNENALNTASTYSSDMPLFKSLGLTLFANIPTKEQYFVGEVNFDNGSIVKIWVYPMPAMFWKFEVFIAERRKIMMVSTGSGKLSKYWKTIILTADDLIDFKYKDE